MLGSISFYKGLSMQVHACESPTATVSMNLESRGFTHTLIRGVSTID